MIKLFLLVLFWLPDAFAADFSIEGGEIGNAFLPYHSQIGRYSIEYPASWRYFDLSTATSFSDPAAASPEEASFFSVLADRFPGIRTMPELKQHLAFFHPGEVWSEAEVAGLPGFRNSGSPRIYYLFRGSEDLLSIRYRAAHAEHEAGLLQMLQSLKVE